MSRLLRDIPKILILIAVMILDFGSKYLVETNMKEWTTGSISIINNFFYLTFLKNRGVAFGLAQGKVPIIAVVNVIAVIAIIYYLVSKKTIINEITRYALFIILGGAFGNLYDRLIRGYVVDFIDFRGIWPYVFNVADTAVFIGAALIILDNIIDRFKKEESK